MRLTNYSDYALRTLMYLATMPNKNELVTISAIAESYQISKNHLTKIIHQLSQIGYIESVRGKNGGIRLAKPKHSIYIGEVLRHTEPDFNIVPCLQNTKNFLKSEVSAKATVNKQSNCDNQSRDNNVDITQVVMKVNLDDLNNSHTTTSSHKLAEPDTTQCAIFPACKLQIALSEATMAFLKVLDTYTLADIIKNETEMWKLLG